VWESHVFILYGDSEALHEELGVLGQDVNGIAELKRDALESLRIKQQQVCTPWSRDEMSFDGDVLCPESSLKPSCHNWWFSRQPIKTKSIDLMAQPSILRSFPEAKETSTSAFLQIFRSAAGQSLEYKPREDAL